MATHAEASDTESVGTTLLKQLAELDTQSMSPATARKLLELHFNPSQQEQVDRLSRKAQLGTLTTSEGRELDELIHVGNLLAILQSKARQAIKHANASS